MPSSLLPDLLTVGQWKFSIVPESEQCLRRFQPGEVLIGDCEIFAKLRLKLYCRCVNDCDPSSDLDRGGGGGRGAEPEDSVSVGRHAGQTELRELDGQASVLHTGTRCK